MGRLTLFGGLVVTVSMVSCGGQCKCRESSAPNNASLERSPTPSVEPQAHDAAAASRADEGDVLWGASSADDAGTTASQSPLLLRTLAIKPGDSKSTVEQVYGRHAADFRRNPASHLPEHFEFEAFGVSVYFDSQDKVRRIKVEAPFEGELLGVRIGDSPASVRGKLGKPEKLSKDQSMLMDPFLDYLQYTKDGHHYTFCGSASSGTRHIIRVFID